MTTRATPGRRDWRALDWIEPDRLAWPAVAVAVIASGVLLTHLTRGTSFWADDWSWITTRRGDTLDAFLSPYNGHLSVVPVAMYRLLFAIFGIGSYTPYRLVVIALSLVVGITVFVYARPRTGALIALLAAVLMLFLGPGWQDTMWAFQIPWLIVCVAGLAAFMLLDRRSARADAGACALILLSVASTSLGLAFLIGAAVDLALSRRRRRDVWIWGIPLGLYIIWGIAYRPNAIALSQITSVPLSIAQAAAASLSVLTGVSGIAPFASTANALTYGWPLLVVALAMAAFRVGRTWPSARTVSLAVVFVVFAASVSIVHAGFASPLASRYVYVYCLLALVLAVELASGTAPTVATGLALVLVVAMATLSNVGALRAFGAYIRSSGQTTNGALTALELDRGSVSADATVQVALYQFVKMRAGAFFTAQRSLGSPAYSLTQLAQAPAAAQTAADSQLLSDGDLSLWSMSSPLATGSGALPAVVTATSVTVTRSRNCLVLEPLAALAPGASATAQLRLGGANVAIASGGTPATLSARRFAATFTTLSTMAPDGSAMLRIRRDAAAAPWYLQISSIAPVRVCPLAR